MSWIPHPTILDGERVLLVPLEKEHISGLIAAAGNKDIWTWYSYNGLDTDVLIRHFEEALEHRATGEEYPFAVIDKSSGKVFGTTRYMKMNKEHRNLEIGWTWYNPDYWSKGYNEECKLLLLQYAFEQLQAVRVQIVAWEKNMRSRKAIERIGGRFEGILRNAAIRQGGARNLAFYSIVPEEWEGVKRELKALMRQKYARNTITEA